MAWGPIQAALFEKYEREWLADTLNPNREPSKDPFFEMLAGVVRLRSNLYKTGCPPCARMDIELAAWRVILRSPITQQVSGAPDPDRSVSFSVRIMGIPVLVRTDMPEGVIAFVGSDNQMVRLVILTNLTTDDGQTV